MTVILTAPPVELERDDSVHAATHEQFLHPELERALSSATARRPLAPHEKARARRWQAAYLLATEDACDLWGYLQRRRMESLGDDPAKGGRSDCSENCTASFYWAKLKTGLPIEDPNGLGFNGYGFTGTLLAANASRKVPEGRRYYVGDMAIYGHGSVTTHVVTCRKNGHAADAVWTSNGSQAGPYPVRLNYRSDLLAVVRPWSYR